MVELSNTQLILAVVWFFIGFGAGFFILRLWLYILAALIIAFLMPFILPLLGIQTPFTTEQAINAVERGITILASFIARNTYSVSGFALGIIVGIIATLLRR